MDRLLFTSASAARRLEVARERIASALEEGRRVTVLAPSREAGRELVRAFAHERGACARLEPTTLIELALTLARSSLVRRGETFVAGAGLDALVAEALEQPGGIGRYEEVRERPGTPRAIAQTLEALLLADLSADALLGVDPALATIAARVSGLCATRRLVPTATLLSRAIAALREGAGGPTDVVLLDHALPSTLEAELARSLVRRARRATITLPHGDGRTRARWVEGLDLAEQRDDEGSRCARALFHEGTIDVAPSTPPAVLVRSGTTEAEECLELARLVLAELDGARPTPLDRIAIVVRDLERYRVPLAEALGRAKIPFHLERAARRPDPAGRAFLSLLECAASGLSARAFADYLAFGVLPEVDAAGAPVRSPERGEAADRASRDDDEDEGGDEKAKKRAVIGGALRAPRHWERLLVDAAVVGGGPERWARRLDGLAEELRRALGDDDDRESPERRRASQRLTELERLTRFALPIIERLGALPERGPLSELLPRLEELARAALLEPRRVLEVLSQLAPLARSEGEGALLSLDDVRRVLLPRLHEITSSPPDRGGTLRVIAADAIAGRSFELLLVPGLVERSFPRRILQDPILPDAARAAIAPRPSDSLDGDAGPGEASPLASSHDRAEDERMLLRRITQAAPRLVASFPRRDERNRERVPSLYLLELVRADRGELVPASRLLAASASTEMAPGWPAPASAERAIDLREADLSTLAALLASTEPADAKRARAHFLVSGTQAPGASIVRRALLARHNTHGALWRSHDGLVTKDPAVLALLARERPSARVYSATALESFAACPYRFYLRAVARLKARETADAIETLDPMTRGSLIHAMQFALVTEARERGLSVIDDQAALGEALDRIVGDVAREARDRLVPAIDTVFDDEIAAIRKDLRAWLHHLGEEARQTGFVPALAELGFGEPGGDAHDPASVRAPIEIRLGDAGGPVALRLRGSIDLVERGDGTVRATDYKTGKADADPHARIGGGTTLQPLLYALTLEAMLAQKTLSMGDPAPRVVGGRLWYCTTRGEDRRVEIALDDEGRAAIAEVLSAIDRAITTGFFPRAPSPSGKKGCDYCDYLAICGPDAAKRAAHKGEDRRLDALVTLRSKP